LAAYYMEGGMSNIGDGFDGIVRIHGHAPDGKA
jgi:hypothetical protein